MRACAGCVSAGWSDLGHCWGISCSNWSSVLIHTFHCDWIWFSDILLVWSEGHCTVWRNGVSSFAWNHFFLASICEGWFNCFIDWNQWITTCKRWSAGLRKALRACAGCVSAGWSDFLNNWSISCYSRLSIFIHHSNLNWSCWTIECF